MACSGQAFTHALQRVHRSRSIGLSCVHCASNAPSQPVRLRSVPLWIGIAPLDRELDGLRAAGGEHRDGQPVLERLGPEQRAVERADDQQLAFRAIGDAGDRIGLGQRGLRDQRGELGRGARATGATSRPLRAG